MKFGELINYLDEIYPRSLSVPGDSDGVDVCADYDIEVGGILLALDVTLGAVEYARARGFNCILSHHAMIYEPLNKLDAALGIAAKKAAALARHDICAAAFHTRLDCVSGGVNDCLLAVLGIKNSEILLHENLPLGRICSFDNDITVAEFAETADKSLKRFFKETFDFEIKGCARFTNGSRKIKKLAVVGGHGMSCTVDAAKAGADTFFTGEGKFHDIVWAHENYNMSVITAGHFETEAVVLPELKRAVLARFPKARIDYFLDGFGGLI